MSLRDTRQLRTLPSQMFDLCMADTTGKILDQDFIILRFIQPYIGEHERGLCFRDDEGLGGCCHEENQCDPKSQKLAEA
jgi:hypothetical protein